MRAVRPVRIGCRPRVGAGADDVRAVQAAIASAQVNVSAAVETCALPQSSKDAWYTLAAQCIAYASKEPIPGMVDAMAAEGATLRSELEAWRATLNEAGCTVPTFDWRTAPKNVPTPGTADPLGDLLNNAKGLLLLAALWVATDGGKRL